MYHFHINNMQDWVPFVLRRLSNCARKPICTSCFRYTVLENDVWSLQTKPTTRDVTCTHTHKKKSNFYEDGWCCTCQSLICLEVYPIPYNYYLATLQTQLPGYRFSFTVVIWVITHCCCATRYLCCATAIIPVTRFHFCLTYNSTLTAWAKTMSCRLRISYSKDACFASS